MKKKVPIKECVDTLLMGSDEEVKSTELNEEDKLTAQEFTEVMVGLVHSLRKDIVL